MKKLIVLLVALCLFLCACQKNVGDSPNNTEDLPKNNEIAISEAYNSPPTSPEPPVDPIETTADEKKIEEPSLNGLAVTSLSSGELSSEWTSFQVILDGVFYQLPAPFQEFAAQGWVGKTSYDDLTETMSPNRYSTNSLENSGNCVSAAILNLSENTIPINECHVFRLSFDDSDLRNSKGIILVLPGGITIGAEMETVRSLYGDPTETRESEYNITWAYKQESYASVEIKFSPETKLVTSLKIENAFLKEPNVSAALSGDIPDVVKNYNAPAELGNDCSSFNVRYAGDLYTIPAPLSVFLENGWTMVDSSQTVSSRSSMIGFSISKNNQTLRTNLYNYSDSAQPAEYCFVSKIQNSDFGPNLPLELPGGITKDSSYDDIIKAYGQPDKESDSSSFNNYFYGKVNDGISISIRKENSEITTIEVQNQPRNLN